MATSAKRGGPQPKNRSQPPDFGSYRIPVDVAPVAQTSEDTLMGVLGWVLAVILVAFLLPLLAFLYLDILEVKPELAVQRNTGTPLIVYENTQYGFSFRLVLPDFDSLHLAVEGHVWNCMFLHFGHFVTRLTRVCVNRIARRGSDLEHAMDFIRRSTVEACPSPVQFR